MRVLFFSRDYPKHAIDFCRNFPRRDMTSFSCALKATE